MNAVVSKFGIQPHIISAHFHHLEIKQLETRLWVKSPSVKTRTIAYEQDAGYSQTIPIILILIRDSITEDINGTELLPLERRNENR